MLFLTSSFGTGIIEDAQASDGDLDPVTWPNVNDDVLLRTKAGAVAMDYFNETQLCILHKTSSFIQQTFACLFLTYILYYSELFSI